MTFREFMKPINQWGGVMDDKTLFLLAWVKLLVGTVLYCSLWVGVFFIPLVAVQCGLAFLLGAGTLAFGAYNITFNGWE